MASANGERARPPVTLREVARLAGVHPATVSRALNPETRDLVNEATAKRVDEAVAQLGYRPNRLARGLKLRRSLTVGVVVPDITNPFFPPIVRGIEDRLDADGYTALLTNTDGDVDREQRAVDTLLARQVDGFILAAARREDPVVRDAVAAGHVVVLVNRRVDDDRVPAVVPDDHGGAALAVEHLAALGHERIGHVAGPQSTSTGLMRRNGFRDAMRRRGLRATALTEATAFTEQAGAAAAEELLAGHPDITAIVAANDLIALGCVSALAAAGRRCPDDVSIVGFNDMPFIDKLAPPLTTIRVPHYELGRGAADRLLARIAGNDTAPTQTTLPVELIVRGSTAPPAG